MSILSRTPLTTGHLRQATDLADHLRLSTTEAISAMRYASVAAQELERYADIALLTRPSWHKASHETTFLHLPIGPADQ